MELKFKYPSQILDLMNAFYFLIEDSSFTTTLSSQMLKVNTIKNIL